MLHLNIINYKDKTHCINSIFEDKKLISLFNENTNKIDLSCLENRIGEKIIVSYYKEENDGQLVIESTKETILTKYDIDEHGVEKIEFNNKE